MPAKVSAVLSASRRSEGVAAGSAINRRTVSSQILCSATGSRIQRPQASGCDADRSSGGTFSRTAAASCRVSPAAVHAMHMLAIARQPDSAVNSPSTAFCNTGE